MEFSLHQDSVKLWNKLLELEKKIDYLLECLLEDTESAATEDSGDSDDDLMEDSSKSPYIKRSKTSVETGRKTSSGFREKQHLTMYS